MPVGYKWVSIRKRNEKNEIIKYKARFVTQGFSQRPNIYYKETYAPVMDVITSKFSFATRLIKNLDVITSITGAYVSL